MNDIYEIWVLVVNSLYHDEPYYFSTEKKLLNSLMNSILRPIFLCLVREVLVVLLIK